MLRASITFTVVLSFMILMLPAHGSQPLYAQQPPRRRWTRRQAPRTGAAAGGPIQSIDARTAGMQKIDGFFPLYWDERTGSMFVEIPKLDTDILLNTGLAAGLGSNDIGLDRGGGGGARIVSFQRVGPRVLMVQPNMSFRSSSANPLERKSVEDSFAKSVLWGFTVAGESNGRVLVDATDFLLRDITGAGNALRPGTYRVDRTRSAFYMPRTKAFPEELRSRNDADLRQRRRRRTRRRQRGRAAAGSRTDSRKRRRPRRRWRRRARRRALLRLGRQRHADRRRGDDARARLVRRAAGRQLQAALRRSARRLRRPDLRRLQRADRRADADALHPASSPGEERSECGGQRAGQADSVLGRFGRAGRREEGAGRRRELVEPGVRSGRLPQRLQGRRAARRRRSDGHPLQHDQLGPPLDARLELGRIGVRPAHRRDPQGDRHARIAARPAGLPDLRGADLAVRRPAPRSRTCSTRRRSSASASCRRTRSATRSASATTTTTAKRAGSR